MSTTFDCYVDTTEMAQTINSVKGHVDGTTGAVVAMQTAVIAAEKKGADLVCKRVNQGFYAMVHSQISQKMAKLQSRVDAELMRLNQQRKQLVGIRKVMERDYQTICARYLKLFNTLNRELRQRITELDRPVIQFAMQETEKMTNRNEQTVSTVPVGQAESVRLANKFVSSRLKHAAAKAIGSIESFIGSANALNAITGRIMLPRRTAGTCESIAVPAIVLECNYDASGSNQTYVYVSQIGDLPQHSRSKIEEGVFSASRSGAMPWKESAEKPVELVYQFRNQVAQAGLPPRVAEMVNRMFDASTISTL